MRPADLPDAWIKPLRTQGERLRLLCFPYAGGAPQVFQSWARWLPAGVGLHAVHLPGRGTRMRDAPLDRVAPIVGALVQALRGMQDLPLVFFGHSMGALLAFETARALQRQRHAGPRLLIASGCRSPELIGQREKIHGLPDAAFLGKLSQLGGTPAEFLDNQELMEVLMPMLRADFSVVDTYEYRSSIPLDCPITVCAGAQDRFACGAAMAGWRAQTVGGFAMHELQGGHFFIHQQEQEVRQIVLRDLQRWGAA